MARRAWIDDDAISRNSPTNTSTLTNGKAYPTLKPATKGFQPSFASVTVASLTVISAIAGVVTLVMVGDSRSWLLTLVIGLDLILALGAGAFVLLWFNPRRVRFWVVAVIAVALIVGNAVIVKIGIDLTRFGANVQPPAAGLVTYDIVVLDEGPIRVSQLQGTVMGEDEDDPLADLVHEEIAKMVEVSYQPVSPWTGLINQLISQDVVSVVIEDALMQVVSETDPTTFEKLRILTQFGVIDSRENTEPTEPPVGSSIMIYISGIDTYGQISNRARSDVNILMLLNPTTGKALLVNTPRDYYVALHGKTGLKDKLTHAGVFGIDTSVGTMEDLYDINIDFYLRINFSSLIKVVDAVGGIDVNSDYDFTSDGYTFVKGKNHMDGKKALAFSRERHVFAAGDRVRGQNQQRVIEGIISQLTNPSVLVGYNKVLEAIEPSIQTSMPIGVLTKLVQRQIQSGQSWDVESISVNGNGSSQYTYSYPGQKLYVMIPDEDTVTAAKQRIQAVKEG